MKIRDSIRQHRKTFVLILGIGLCLITTGATWLKLKGPLKSFDEGPAVYTHYNNYLIFKSAFYHLVEEKNLYVLYPEEHHDLFKYSPGFALFFGVFASLPDGLGLLLWNLLNVLVFFFVLQRKEAPWSAQLPILFIFLLPELVTSTQNSQSNALMTGLLMLSYFDLEGQRSGRAACWIVLATFIKIYAGIAALLFLFYPQKIRFLLTGALVTVVMFSLPLIVTSPDDLWIQYQSWWNLLSQDHTNSYGISLMQLINLVIPGFHQKTLIQILGLIILIFLALPLIKLAKDRLNFFALILLTLIIFNHKTESATFIVAVSGVAIWYFSKPNPAAFEFSVMIFAFFFTVLGATDVFPRIVRQNWIVPYAMKIWPCILVYGLICYELCKSNWFSLKRSVSQT